MMNDNQIVVKLTGLVTADEYRSAINYIVGLVNALTEVVADKADVEWQVSNLSYGSAIVEFAGFSSSQDVVREVVAAYATATQAASREETIPYPASVRYQLESLTGLINGHIKSIEFGTNKVECVIRKPLPPTNVRQTKWVSLGSVRGKVQMISERDSLHFNLYDSVFDKAVSCYMLTEQQEMMRGLWGKDVYVTGTISRNPDTGQPTAIRDIIDIEVINYAPRDSYKSMRGILDFDPNEPTANDRLRQLRDDD